mmetsp:Transcript_12811/g.37374  ORF Transcript_12811/g.37374 Transcript_12811/m.37374 type:complete len:299 (-) Transcript_12811:1160-2056(-)
MSSRVAAAGAGGARPGTPSRPVAARRQRVRVALHRERLLAARRRHAVLGRLHRRAVRHELVHAAARRRRDRQRDERRDQPGDGHGAGLLDVGLLRALFGTARKSQVAHGLLAASLARRVDRIQGRLRRVQLRLEGGVLGLEVLDALHEGVEVLLLHGAPAVVVVAARAVVVAAVLGLVAVAFDQIGLHAQRVLVVVAALRRDDVVELAAALVRVVFEGPLRLVVGLHHPDGLLGHLQDVGGHGLEVVQLHHLLTSRRQHELDPGLQQRSFFVVARLVLADVHVGDGHDGPGRLARHIM